MAQDLFLSVVPLVGECLIRIPHCLCNPVNVPTPPCLVQEWTSMHRLVGCEAVVLGVQASAGHYTSQLGARAPYALGQI